MDPHFLPLVDHTNSYWLRESSTNNFCSTEAFPETCDFLIAGGGFAGVSAAYHLARDFAPGASIVLLEARDICSGATGRSGGHLRPELYEAIPKYIERFGIEAGTQWAEFEIANAAAIAQLIKDENLDCDFLETISTDHWINDKGNSYRYENLISTGKPCFERIQFASGFEASSSSPVSNVKASITYPAASLDPYKFILQLLGRAIEVSKGNLAVFSHTPATRMRQIGVSKHEVETPRGTIHANKIIHASNAYVAGLLPEYRKSIIPCKGVCTYVKSSAEVGSDLLVDRLCVIRDTNNVLSYLVPIEKGNKGFVVGGASREFRHNKSAWYDTVDDKTSIIAGEQYFQDNYMMRTFDAWDNTKTYAQNVWTGIMGYSADSLPHLGEVPDRHGQYIAAGFNGHGMPVIWLAAKGVAALASSSANTYEDIEYLPSIAKTTSQRLAKISSSKDGGDIA